MASTINAKTTGVGGIDATGDASGVLALQTVGVTGLTIDASQNVVLAKGLTVGATAAPAFCAYPSGAGQSVINNTNVKLAFNTEFFDTNSNFDAVTNYRFTPTVTGYYQVDLCGLLSAATGVIQIGIFKNGGQHLVGITVNNTSGVIASASTIIYFNGSTDYIEGYIYQTSGGTLTTLANRSDLYRFSAFLARSA